MSFGAPSRPPSLQPFGCCVVLGPASAGVKDKVPTIYADEPTPLAGIAAAYGLTAERVRQIEAKAIGKLRRHIGPRVRDEVCGHA